MLPAVTRFGSQVEAVGRGAGPKVGRPADWCPVPPSGRPPVDFGGGGSAGFDGSIESRPRNATRTVSRPRPPLAEHSGVGIVAFHLVLAQSLGEKGVKSVPCKGQFTQARDVQPPGASHSGQPSYQLPSSATRSRSRTATQELRESILPRLAQRAEPRRFSDS